LTERVITLYHAYVPTQAERRASTRGALLDAAAATLVGAGATGLTTAAVAARADLSNGALFRYFPTRLDLVAATVEHVLAELRDHYVERFATTAQVDVRRLLQLLWECMSDPRLASVYELYTQCRTDDALLAAIQPIVMDHVDRIGELAAAVLDHLDRPLPGDPQAFVMLAILSMQGLIINNVTGTGIGVERDLITALATTYGLTKDSPTS
jgi:AcrR family transcriptional regulator